MLLRVKNESLDAKSPPKTILLRLSSSKVVRQVTQNNSAVTENTAWYNNTGVPYYKTKDERKRFITRMNIHEKSKIKHSISLRQSGQVFSNPIIKHLKSLKTLK